MKIAILYSHAAHSGIINGFRRAGSDVFPVFYGLGMTTFIKKLYCNLIGKKVVLEDNFNNGIKKIFEVVDKEGIDAILVLKGHELYETTKIILKKRSIPVYQWTTDSVRRVTGQASLLPYADKVYFQDGSDIALHNSGEWLPLGFDDEVFTPQESRIIDVLLLGNLLQPYYETRAKYFYEIARLTKQDINIVFVGANEEETLSKHFKQLNVQNMGRVPYDKYVSLIRNSRICVNIHQDDGGKPLNPLFFSIPATNSVQITESRNYFKEWLIPDVEYFPTDISHVNNKIENLLNNYAHCDLALHERMKSIHSFQARATKIMNHLVGIS